jgi:A-factor biosynthesis hotdog protein
MSRAPAGGPRLSKLTVARGHCVATQRPGSARAAVLAGSGPADQDGPDHASNGNGCGAGLSRPWAANLVVDLDDRFHFDHPLDHVPGMLLVSAFLALARDLTGGLVDQSGVRTRLSLTFPQFCELDEAVQLHAVPVAPGAWALRAEQADQAVCRGALGLGRDPGGAAVDATEPSVDRRVLDRAPGEMVHRVHPENIAVGVLVQPGPDRYEAAVLDCPTFARSAAGASRSAGWTPEEIIEAARELCLMLGHVAHARPPDGQALWLELRADLPGGLPRATPLRLRWWVAPADRARARFDLDLVAPGRVAPLGSLTCVSHTLSRRAYEKTRAAGRRR